MSSNTPQVVWFKRDLRVADHAPLALAAEAGPVVPLFLLNLKRAVAGLKMTHLRKITSAFEFSGLTLTDFGELSRVVPGLRP